MSAIKPFILRGDALPGGGLGWAVQARRGRRTWLWWHVPGASALAEPLRAFAHALRAAINAHPCAAALLLTRPVLPRPALEAFDTLLGNLRDDGFDDAQAAQILRSVTSVAMSDAIAALTYRSLARSQPQPASEAEAWMALSQLLPDDTPTHLVRAAYAVCACEPDTDFTLSWTSSSTARKSSSDSRDARSRVATHRRARSPFGHADHQAGHRVSAAEADRSGTPSHPRSQARPPD